MSTSLYTALSLIKLQRTLLTYNYSKVDLNSKEPITNCKTENINTPGEIHTSALASTQRGSVLADPRPVTLWHPLEVLVQSARFEDLAVPRLVVLLAEENVTADGVGEQPGLL